MDMGAYPAIAVAILALPADPAGELETAGRYREAEAARRAAFDRARRRGDDSEAAADAAEKLADNLAMQARLVDAAPLYRMALDIRLKRHGEMHPATARSLRQMAILQLQQGRGDEAEQFAARALTVQRAVSPVGDIEVAWALNTLAQVRSATRKPFDADPILREAVSIARAAMPADPDAVAVLLNNLGTNYYRMSVSAVIPPAFRRRVGTARGVVTAAASEERVIDPDRLRLLDQGRLALNEALALTRRKSGDDHPDTANLLNGLAANRLAAGAQAEAIRLYREAQAIKRKFLLPEDRDRIVGAWSLGAALVQMPGFEAEARTQLRAASDGILKAQTRHREFDSAAGAELRSYAPVFIGQVRVAWTLANRP